MNSPPGWAGDSLTGFISHMHSNQFATFHNDKKRFEHLASLDALFLTLGSGIEDPQDLLAPLLLMRCHSSFRATAVLSTGGQCSEAFCTARAALEYAGYSLLFCQHPDLVEVWFNRDEGEHALRQFRQRITHSRTRAAIEALDPRIASIFQDLYEHCIIQGAHPNQSGIISAARYQEHPEKVVLGQIYLHRGDSAVAQHTVKFVAEVGLLCLHIFRLHPALSARYVQYSLDDQIRNILQSMRETNGTAANDKA